MAHHAHEHGQHGHEHGHGHGHGTAPEDVTALAQVLDLDAEVLHAYLSDATSWIAELTDRPPHRILDLGSGTGAGTFALLERFDQAAVIAVDLSEQMLQHLAGKAAERGVADRVTTAQADLDVALPEITSPVDLVWASASLHHLADPERTLTEVLAALRPGGLLAAMELDSFPRFLPDDLGFGRPGLEERCHAVMDARRSAELPHLGADWGPRLAGAGFTVEGERTFAIELTPPLPAAAGRYAQLSLRRMRTGLDGELSPDDLTALDSLLDDDAAESVLRRTDLSVRTTRTLWLARRP